MFLFAGRVRATFLVDGFVGGTWKLERQKKVPSLVIEPFGALAKKDREVLIEEGEQLIGFIEDDPGSFEVRIERS